MKSLSLIVSTIKNVFALFLVVIIPVFFLPITQEYYITSKLYLLAFSGLILLVLSLTELFLTKKIIWQKKIFDNAFFLFLVTVGLSILLISPNKIQAILNPNFGFLSIVSLFVFYFYLSRNNEIIKKINLVNAINISGLVVVLSTLLFRILKDIVLPPNLAFLKNPFFTPLGMQIDLVIFLGFFVVFSLNQILINKSVNKKALVLNSIYLILNSITLFMTIYFIFNPDKTVNKASIILLPPLKLSWFAAVEVLKNPINALFGIGVDNFTSMFTKVKDFSYNQSSLWEIQSFTVSRSAVLHILTETGIFGLLGFVLLILGLIKQVVSQNKSFLLTFCYLLLAIVFLPPSFITFFLLTVFMAYIANQKSTSMPDQDSSTFDISGMVPLYLGIPVIVLTIVFGAGFFLFKSYQAEYFYKKALNSYINNNLKGLYDNQRQAILINPNIEKYRISFSQTNLLVADNIISFAVESAKKKSPNTKVELSAQEQQTVSQAIQAAISEAKAAVALNPQKAGNWENLGIIYRNIMNFVQGQADAWTISAYQQAIGLDPQNPNYRFNLGSIYYSLGVYDEAARIFEQATVLKPDWSNAYYNLAWALYQKNDFQKAALGMQNVLYLLDPKKDQVDYQKASRDLEDFKKKLPGAELTPTPAPQLKEQLSLPTPPQKVEPPIKLPKEASPEAR